MTARNLADAFERLDVEVEVGVELDGWLRLVELEACRRLSCRQA